MTFKQKVEYFWEYYKWLVIIPILLFFIIFTFVRSYIEETKEPTLYIAVMNCNNPTEAKAYLTEKYPKECGIDTDEYPVRVEGDYIHPKVMDGMAAADTTTVASIQKYQNQLVSGVIDITISTDWVVDGYSQSDSYKNLEEFLPDDLTDALKDSFYYVKTEDGKEIPVGIYVKNTELFGEFYEAGKPILTISSYTKRADKVIDFLRWFKKDGGL